MVFRAHSIGYRQAWTGVQAPAKPEGTEAQLAEPAASLCAGRFAAGSVAPAVMAMLLGLWGCSETSGPQVPGDDDLSVSGETIVRWSEHNFAILTTLDDGTSAGFGLIRELAMVHIAMHDAANGARSEFEQYALRDSDSMADPALSAAAAAHAMLVALRPGKTGQVDAFLKLDLERVSDPDSRQRSIDLGAAAASAIMEARDGDGFFEVVPYTFGPIEPGVWQPVAGNSNAVGTQLPFVTPFALESADQFRAPLPPMLSSSLWKSGFDEVRELGRIDSTERTDDQTHAALFWREQTQFAWNRVARIAATELDKGLWQTARVFALLNIGLIDGLIANFDTKYAYQYWRPFTAIREVDDGRSDTEMDPTWESLNPTPPHPEYNSAQGVLGGAASYPLIQIYGSDFAFELTTSTADPSGSARSYEGFTDALMESALSRVWGGIHFSFSAVPGAEQGLAIGEYIFDHELRPN